MVSVHVGKITPYKRAHSFAEIILRSGLRNSGVVTARVETQKHFSVYVVSKLAKHPGDVRPQPPQPQPPPRPFFQPPQSRPNRKTSMGIIFVRHNMNGLWRSGIASGWGPVWGWKGRGVNRTPSQIYKARGYIVCVCIKYNIYIYIYLCTYRTHGGSILDS